MPVFARRAGPVSGSVPGGRRNHGLAMSLIDRRRPNESGVHSLIQEQIDYYEARAAEYDRQLERAGRYGDAAVAPGDKIPA